MPERRFFLSRLAALPLLAMARGNAEQTSTTRTPLKIMIKSAWGSDDLGASSFMTHPYLNGWHVDRSRFDSMLSTAAARAGAQVFKRTTAESVQRTGRSAWSVEANSPDGHLHFLARFVVDAAGRSGRLSSRLGARRHIVDHMVGITLESSNPKFENVMPSLIEAHPLGWWYSAGLPSGNAIAIFFTDAEVCAAERLATQHGWRRLLHESIHTRDRVGGCVFPPKPRVFPAGTHLLSPGAGDSWLAVGDALIGRDPLSSSGVDFALASAERANELLQALAKGSKHAADAFDAAVRSDFSNYLRQRNGYYAMESRWPDSPYWQRRQVLPSLAQQRAPRSAESERGTMKT